MYRTRGPLHTLVSLEGVASQRAEGSVNVAILVLELMGGRMSGGCVLIELSRPSLRNNTQNSHLHRASRVPYPMKREYVKHLAAYDRKQAYRPVRHWNLAGPSPAFEEKTSAAHRVRASQWQLGR